MVLARLASSIREDGMLMPITVIKENKGVFKVIDGVKRLKAAKMIGYTHIYSIILPLPAELALLCCCPDLPFQSAEQLRRCALLADFANDSRLLELSAKFYRTSNEKITRLSSISSLSGWERSVLTQTDLQNVFIALAGITDKRFREYAIDSYKEMYDDFERGVLALIANKDKRYTPFDKIILKDIRIVFNSIDKSLARLTRSGITVKSKKSENNEEYRVEITIKKP